MNIKIKNNLLILFSFLLLAACARPLQPEYAGVKEIHISRVTGGEATVFARVDFYNPNNFSGNITSADISVMLNDKVFTHYKLDSNIRIGKLANFEVPVAVPIQLKDLAGNALLYLLKKNLSLRAEGFIKIRKSLIGFRIPVEYNETFSSSQLDTLIGSIR
jgi:LEA14-like dessication related protein